MWKITAILKTELKDSFNLKIPQGIKNKIALTLKTSFNKNIVASCEKLVTINVS